MLVRVPDVTAALQAVRLLDDAGVPWVALGEGTNLLVTDDGIEGAVVKLVGGLTGIEVLEHQPGGRVSLSVGAGCKLARLLSLAGRSGWSGVEALWGIPGSVAGAVVMNAGTRYGTIGPVVSRVRVVSADGDGWFGRGSLEFGYRSSRLPPGLVAQVELQLLEGQKESVLAVKAELLRLRREAQPPLKGTAGSFFKNPAGEYAGALIERAGMKGERRGGALCSHVHANFLVNTGSASATEILELACLIRERVWRQFGVELEPEVQIVGRGAAEWSDRLSPWGHA